MVDFELLRSDGILIIRPKGSLEAGDFQRISQEVDPYIAANGKLHGVMIDAESFPGWRDFAALVAHLRFVRDHHRKIEKIAAVSDSGFLTIAPTIASHFVQAEVRHFPHSEGKAALDWLQGKETSGTTPNIK
jgi:stage II sporulation SpoAA-like protein